MSATRQVIGAGSYGRVYQIEGSDGKKYAIKELKADDVLKNGDGNLNEECSQFQTHLRELNSLLALNDNNSDHTVNIKTFSYDQSRKKLDIVMNYCNGGSLATLIDIVETIPEAKAKEILRQLLSGLSKIHELNIGHRDLKPGNIMLDFPDEDFENPLLQEQEIADYF